MSSDSKAVPHVAWGRYVKSWNLCLGSPVSRKAKAAVAGLIAICTQGILENDKLLKLQDKLGTPVRGTVPHLSSVDLTLNQSSPWGFNAGAPATLPKFSPTHESYVRP